MRVGSVEEVPQPHLRTPTRQKIRVVDECLRRARKVEYWCSRGVESHERQRRRRPRTRNLPYAPIRVEQVSDVQQVEAELHRVASFAYTQKSQVLQHAHIEIAVPRVHRPEALRDLATMLAQIRVLPNERVELRPLLRRRHRTSRGVHERIEHDLGLRARNVDEIVARGPVAVDVTRVDERVPVAAGTREPVAFRHLEEGTNLRAESRRPRLRIHRVADDAMALTELGEAELRLVRVALDRLVLPQHTRDLGGLEVVLRGRVAIAESHGRR